MGPHDLFQKHPRKPRPLQPGAPVLDLPELGFFDHAGLLLGEHRVLGLDFPFSFRLFKERLAANQRPLLVEEVYRKNHIKLLGR